jgi:hypothetical protein
VAYPLWLDKVYLRLSIRRLTSFEVSFYQSGYCGASIRDRFYQTICQLDTPLNNPSKANPTDIEVVDPAHPLYGRRFAMVSVSRPHNGPRQALVIYQNDIMVHIPVSATNLSFKPSILSKAKLSPDALAELVDLIRQMQIIDKKGGSI